MQSPTTTEQSSVTAQPVERGPAVIGRVELLSGEGRVARSWLIRQQRCSLGAGAGETVRLPREAIGEGKLVVVFGRRHTLVKAVRGEFRVGTRSVREWLIDAPTEVGAGSCRLVVYPASYVRANSIADNGPADNPSQADDAAGLDTELPAAAAAVSEELRQALIADARAAFAESVLPLQESLRGLSLEWREFLQRSAEGPGVEEEPAERVEAKLPVIDAAIETLDQRVADMSSRYDDALHSLSEQIREQFRSFEERIEVRDDQPSSVESALRQLHCQIAELQSHLSSLSEKRSDPVPRTDAGETPSPTNVLPMSELDAEPPHLVFERDESADSYLVDPPSFDDAVTVEDAAVEDAAIEDAAVDPMRGWRVRDSEPVTPDHDAEIAAAEHEIFDYEPARSEEYAEEYADQYGSSDLAAERLGWEPEIDELPASLPGVESPGSMRLDFSDEFNRFVSEHVDEPENKPAAAGGDDPVTDAELIEKHFIENYRYPDSELSEADAAGEPEELLPAEEFTYEEVQLESDDSFAELELPSWFAAEPEERGVAASRDWVEESVESTDGIVDEFGVETEEPVDEAGPAIYQGADERLDYDAATEPEYVSRQPSAAFDSFRSPQSADEDESQELLYSGGASDPSAGEAAAPSVPKPRTVEATNDDELSVEEYMQQLLRRVKGGDYDTPQPAGNASSPPPPPASPPADMPGQADTTSAAPTQQSAIAASGDIEGPAGDQSQNKDEALEAHNYIPRTTVPESNINLAAMRALANETARTAIALSKSTPPASSGEQIGKMVVSVIGFSIGTAILLLNGLTANVSFVGMLAAYAVFLIWGFEATQNVGLTSRASRGVRIDTPPSASRGNADAKARGSD